jgi:hypothetical protein
MPPKLAVQGLARHKTLFFNAFAMSRTPFFS